MKSKLSSRKLWAALVGVITGIALVVSGNVTEGAATVVASVLGYMMTEGYVDAKAVKAALEVVNEVEKQIDVTTEESEDE
jgi:hypothetical protein